MIISIPCALRVVLSSNFIPELEIFNVNKFAIEKIAAGLDGQIDIATNLKL